MLSRALLALACTGLFGCGTVGYLAHVSLGQLGVLLDREALTPDRIAALSPGERARVAAIQRALAFGESLGLAPSTSYRHLVDGGPDDALQVVVAAPPDRLEPVTWWFPIVGSVSYRGYFDGERARAFARELEDAGFDTYVRPAALYSTLGWFDDPIPRALLAWPEIAVIDTALHELVHETVFVASDVAYNEALATFIAHEATLRLLAERPDAAAEARRRFADQRRFARLMRELGEELRVTYAALDGLGPQAVRQAQAREARASVFARFQGERFGAQTWETTRYRRFPELRLSNAYVVAQSTYLAELDCFGAWLDALDGDLPRFIARVREEPGARPDELEACGP